MKYQYLVSLFPIPNVLKINVFFNLYQIKYIGITYAFSFLFVNRQMYNLCIFEHFKSILSRAAFENFIRVR